MMSCIATAGCPAPPAAAEYTAGDDEQQQPETAHQHSDAHADTRTGHLDLTDLQNREGQRGQRLDRDQYGGE